MSGGAWLIESWISAFGDFGIAVRATTDYRGHAHINFVITPVLQTRLQQPGNVVELN